MMDRLLSSLSPLAQLTRPSTQPEGQVDQWVERLGLQTTWRYTPASAWLVLLAMIFIGVLAGKVASSFLRSGATRIEKRGTRGFATILRSAATPANLFFVTLGLSLGLAPIAMEAGAKDIVRRALTLLYVLSIGWFLFNLVDLIDLWLRSLTARTKSHLDDQLAPLIRKTLRIFLVALVGLYIAQNVFGQDITTWLAGLGIVGLAVSLASQDSIKNLFGSVTIILDRPFIVGERIIFEGFDGSVEEIGFRSTKVRLTNGEVATIPNSKFIDSSVRNVSRRPTYPKTVELPISADMPAPRVLRAVEEIRKALNEPGLREPFELTMNPPKVYFDELRGDVRVIHITYAYPAGDWWAHIDHLQRLQLRVLEVLEQEEIEFGGQKTTLVGDPDQPVFVQKMGEEPNAGQRQ